MVYKDCKLGLNSNQYNKKRTTEFYIEGKPQIYCYGIDTNGGTRQECVTCPNWALGDQCDEDFEKAKSQGIVTMYPKQNFNRINKPLVECLI